MPTVIRTEENLDRYSVDPVSARAKLAAALKNMHRRDAQEVNDADRRFVHLEPRERLAREIADLWRTGSRS